MDHGPNVPSPSRQSFKPLRLLRLKEGEQVIIWITHFIDGGRIKGLFTRHTRDGSLIIPPEDRETRVNGKPGVWKGYISACYWDKPEKAWVPCVVEVTERSEQDFRGKIQRGQLWKISKGPKDGSKKIPLRAAFVEARAEKDTPPAFNVLDKLRNDIFRVAVLALEWDNPLPDLVVVLPIAAAGPGEKMETEPQASTAARPRFSERFANRPHAIADVLPELNGKAAGKDGQP